MKIYDIAVIGGGPAGSMAAIRASELGKSVILAERNNSIGNKLILTGKGRCNITNIASMEAFIKKFKTSGEFLRSALFLFYNKELMEYFESNGLKLKVERQGRVFPVSDKASDVVLTLAKSLKEKKVNMAYGLRITDIKSEENYYILTADNKAQIKARKVVIAAGGASYKATGSTGDGFKMAQHMGHKIMRLKPALVPLKTKESWIKDLQGLSLENIRLTYYFGDKKHASDIGDVMFTHFGVSGPLVLDMSGDIVLLLERHKEIKFTIDLKPGLTKEQIEKKLVNKFLDKGNPSVKAVMQDMLPKRIILTFLSLCKIQYDKRVNQITRQERQSIIEILKAFPVTITGSLPIEEAMVTGGGVSRKDINPRTMESKIVPGIYFAGEVIEGEAPSGGYNLQQAFSTGYLAGESSAKACFS